MTTPKLYSLGDHPEHQAQLVAVRDTWIANALNCTSMTDADRDITREAIHGLYAAAKLPPPQQILFVESPLVGAIATAIASGAWWIRHNPIEARKLFGSDIREDELMHAVAIAAARCVSHGLHALCGEALESHVPTPTDEAIHESASAAIHESASEATRAATREATDAAIHAATEQAARAATREATDTAIRSAISSTIEEATAVATRAATSRAIRTATDAATSAATSRAIRTATDAATSAAISTATDDATRAATDDATRAATDDATRAATDAATDAATSAAISTATREATDAAIRRALDAATWDATWDATHTATSAATLEATRTATSATIHGATWEATSRATSGATETATHAATWETISTATDAATDAVTDAATAAAISAAIHGAISEAADAATDAATDAAISTAISTATHAATDVAIRVAISAATEAAARAATPAAIDVAVHEATDKATYAATHVATWEAIRAATHAATSRVASFLMQCSQHWWKFRSGGNEWSGWCAYLAFFRHVAKLPIDYTHWAHYEAAALHSGPRFMHAKFCIVSNRPEFIHQDAHSRPHCVDGPFKRWRDGVELHYIAGVPVTPRITRGAFTAQDILKEGNAEVRRVMLDKYNAGDKSRWIRDLSAEALHEDLDNQGRPRKLYRIELEDDEPFVMITVTNSSPEPDGTYKIYSFQAHPELRPLPVPGVRTKLGEPQEMTCLNAIASTYGYYGHEYRPLIET